MGSDEPTGTDQATEKHNRLGPRATCTTDGCLQGRTSLAHVFMVVFMPGLSHISLFELIAIKSPCFNLFLLEKKNYS